MGLVQNSGPSKCAGSLFSFPLEPTAKGHSFGFPLNNQKGVHHFEKHPCNLVAPSGPLRFERLLGFSGIFRETFNGGDFGDLRTGHLRVSGVSARYIRSELGSLGASVSIEHLRWAYLAGPRVDDPSPGVTLLDVRTLTFGQPMGFPLNH